MLDSNRLGKIWKKIMAALETEAAGKTPSRMEGSSDDMAWDPRDEESGEGSLSESFFDPEVEEDAPAGLEETTFEDPDVDAETAPQVEQTQEGLTVFTPPPAVQIGDEGDVPGSADVFQAYDEGQVMEAGPADDPTMIAERNELAEQLSALSKTKEYDVDVSKSLSLDPYEKEKFEAMMKGSPSIMLETLGKPALMGEGKEPGGMIDESFDDFVTVPSSELKRWRALAERDRELANKQREFLSPAQQALHDTKIQESLEFWKGKLATARTDKHKKNILNEINNLQSAKEIEEERNELFKQRREIEQRISDQLKEKYKEFEHLLPYRSELREKKETLYQKIKDLEQKVADPNATPASKKKFEKELAKLMKEQDGVMKELEDLRITRRRQPEAREYRKKKVEEIFGKIPELPVENVPALLEQYKLSDEVIRMSPEEKFEGKDNKFVLGILRYYLELLKRPELYGTGMKPQRGHLPTGGSREEAKMQQMISRDIEWLKANKYSDWAAVEKPIRDLMEKVNSAVAASREKPKEPPLPSREESEEPRVPSEGGAGMELSERQKSKGRGKGRSHRKTTLEQWHKNDSTKISIAAALIRNAGDKDLTPIERADEWANVEDLAWPQGREIPGDLESAKYVTEEAKRAQEALRKRDKELAPSIPAPSFLRLLTNRQVVEAIEQASKDFKEGKITKEQVEEIARQLYPEVESQAEEVYSEYLSLPDINEYEQHRKVFDTEGEIAARENIIESLEGSMQENRRDYDSLAASMAAEVNAVPEGPMRDAYANELAQQIKQLEDNYGLMEMEKATAIKELDALKAMKDVMNPQEVGPTREAPSLSEHSKNSFVEDFFREVDSRSNAPSGEEAEEEPPAGQMEFDLGEESRLSIEWLRDQDLSRLEDELDRLRNNPDALLDLASASGKTPDEFLGLFEQAIKEMFDEIEKLPKETSVEEMASPERGKEEAAFASAKAAAVEKFLEENPSALAEYEFYGDMDKLYKAYDAKKYGEEIEPDKFTALVLGSSGLREAEVPAKRVELYGDDGYVLPGKVLIEEHGREQIGDLLISVKNEWEELKRRQLSRYNLGLSGASAPLDDKEMHNLQTLSDARKLIEDYANSVAERYWRVNPHLGENIEYWSEYMDYFKKKADEIQKLENEWHQLIDKAIAAWKESDERGLTKLNEEQQRLFELLQDEYRTSVRRLATDMYELRRRYEEDLAEYRSELMSEMSLTLPETAFGALPGVPKELEEKWKKSLENFYTTIDEMDESSNKLESIRQKLNEQRAASSGDAPDTWIEWMNERLSAWREMRGKALDSVYKEFPAPPPVIPKGERPSSGDEEEKTPTHGWPNMAKTPQEEVEEARRKKLEESKKKQAFMKDWIKRRARREK